MALWKLKKLKNDLIKILNLRYVLCQKRIALYDRCLQTTLGNTCIPDGAVYHLG